MTPSNNRMSKRSHVRIQQWQCSRSQRLLSRPMTNCNEHLQSQAVWAKGYTVWHTRIHCNFHSDPFLFVLFLFFSFIFFPRWMLQGKRVDTKAQRDECMMWNSHVMHDMKFTWINIKLKKKKEKKEKNCWVWWFAYNLSTQQTEAKFFDFRASLGYILSPKTEWDLVSKLKRRGWTDRETRVKWWLV